MKIQILVVILVLFYAMPAVLVENIISEKINTNENYDYEYNSYIDPDIILTKKHLPTLTKAAAQIKDLQIKNFIQQIIDIINNQNLADKNDIKKAINNLNLNTKIKGIHFLCLLHSDGIGYGYPRGIYPFIFDYVFYNFFNSEVFLGPSIYVEWKSPDANTRINGKKIYDESHNGYVFGFLGYTYSGGIWPVIYDIIGICNLVIITDYELS